jgi:hypothetical protein
MVQGSQSDLIRGIIVENGRWAGVAFYHIERLVPGLVRDPRSRPVMPPPERRENSYPERSSPRHRSATTSHRGKRIAALCHMGGRLPTRVTRTRKRRSGASPRAKRGKRAMAAPSCVASQAHVTGVLRVGTLLVCCVRAERGVRTRIDRCALDAPCGPGDGCAKAHRNERGTKPFFCGRQKNGLSRRRSFAGYRDGL